MWLIAVRRVALDADRRRGVEVLDGPSTSEAAHASDSSPILPPHVTCSGYFVTAVPQRAVSCRSAAWRASAGVRHDECDRDRDRLRDLARADGGRRAVGPRRQPGRVDAERADGRELVRRDGGLTWQRDEPRGAARRVRVRDPRQPHVGQPRGTAVVHGERLRGRLRVTRRDELEVARRHVQRRVGRGAALRPGRGRA